MIKQKLINKFESITYKRSFQVLLINEFESFSLKRSFQALLINLFKKQIDKKAPITANFILSNAITMQASLNGGRLKIS